MNLALTTEQQDLRDTVAQFLADRAPVSARTDDPAAWAGLAGDLGLVGLAVPEAYGGLGELPVELFVVLHELGKQLYAGPFLPCVLAAAALARSGDDEACQRFLPGLADGSAVATLAWAEDDTRWTGGQLRTTARRLTAGWLIDGRKQLVLAPEAAALFVVTASTPEGTGLFAVPAEPGAVSARPLPGLDLTRAIGTVGFTAAPAQLIGSVPATPALLAAVLDLARLAIAAESSGGAWRCLELSTEYAKSRHQFGAPIGSYQAIAHACAAMLLDAEQARSAAQYAAAAAACGSAEFPLAAHVAAAFTATAYERVTAATIQVHGGIGFTWEHDAHLYFRRARSAALLFGTSDDELAAVAALAGL